MDSGLTNHGSYIGGGGLGLSWDTSPTELKSMTGSYSNSYPLSGPFQSVSPAPSGGAAWYSPSEGNIHVLHTGDVTRKIDAGEFFFLNRIIRPYVRPFVYEEAATYRAYILLALYDRVV